ncbi:MAG: sigma-70 family RNA polymerase sigma factor [Bryobacteraceae bacterium]|jgi:RNA polymerase sigma factor (sigma-70 family)
MVEATFDQAYPFAARAAQVRATAAVVSGAIPAADLEDFEQEGLTACWLALPKFNPARASLRTFVERVVASRIASLVRAARRSPVHVPLKAAGPRPVDSGAELQELHADIERISSAFGCHDRQLILLLLEHSPAEACRMLGLPRSTVHDRILRMRRSFVRAGYSPIGGCR